MLNKKELENQKTISYASGFLIQMCCRRIQESLTPSISAVYF